MKAGVGSAVWMVVQVRKGSLFCVRSEAAYLHVDCQNHESQFRIS